MIEEYHVTVRSSELTVEQKSGDAAQFENFINIFSSMGKLRTKAADGRPRKIQVLVPSLQDFEEYLNKELRGGVIDAFDIKKTSNGGMRVKLTKNDKSFSVSLLKASGERFSIHQDPKNIKIGFPVGTQYALWKFYDILFQHNQFAIVDFSAGSSTVSLKIINASGI